MQVKSVCKWCSRSKKFEKLWNLKLAKEILKIVKLIIAFPKLKIQKLVWVAEGAFKSA